ncbi:MAG: flagellar hook-associated protein FlgK [Burkholderiaceae bacterium]
MSLLNVGTSGLAAANLGLTTVSHNIANVNTPGYSRQQVVQRAAVAGGIGLFAGKGVEVVGIQRITNQFLYQQANVATSDAASSNMQLGYLNRIADLLTSDESSIPGAINRFFSGLQDLASRPASQTERQTVLSRAQSLAQRFNEIDAQLQTMSAEIVNQIGSAAAKINATAVGIAQLNQQIALQQGNGITPNDLLDQRDNLVRELSQHLKVSTVNQPDGRINIFLTSGDPLVMSDGPSRLEVQADPFNPGSVGLSTSGSSTGGASRIILSSVDLGGGISGLMRLQSDISNARNEIGRMAISLSSQINDQQTLGQDLNGQAGAAMFRISTPKSFSVNGGAGSLDVTITSSSALKASDYRVDYDGINFTVTRLSDGNQTSYTSLPQTLDGIRIAAGATAPVAGQIFVVQPVRDGAAVISSLIDNPSLVAAALPVNATLGSSNTGTVSISGLSVNGPTRSPTLTQPVQISFTSSTNFNYTVNGGPTQTGSINGNGEIVVNGWTLKLSGTPAVGDSISVVANTQGSGDNRNLIIMGRLAQSSFIDGNSITDANGRLISTFGNRASEMAITARANDRLLDQVKQEESAVSGVNLDEEAANLLRYQQAYQAAAKALAAASAVFETILSLGQS